MNTRHIRALELMAWTGLLFAGLAACGSDTVKQDGPGKVDKGVVADRGSTADKGPTGDKGPTADKGTTTDSPAGGCATGFASCTTFDDGTSGSQTITFGTGGFVYSPKCLKVKVGQTVTFSGSFSFHPLAQACGPAQVITNGSGSSASFTFNTAGLYGYYCTAHGTAQGTGMAGSIQVVP